MTIDLPVLLGVLVALGAIVTYAAGALRGIRIWVRKAAGTAASTDEKLTTQSGIPIAVSVERTAVALDRINLRLDQQDKVVRETHEVAQSALTIANAVGRRLDEHLVRDHGAPDIPVQE